MKGGFRIAEWEIEPQINCVKRGEQSCHLEPKVMQVLVQLASHPNEVLSKEQLIHKVWSDTFVGDDVLTRSISEIRRALDDDARSPRIIQTIPKVGYRLIVPVTFESGSGNGHAAAAVAPALETAPKTAPPVLPLRSRQRQLWPLLLIVALVTVGTLTVWLLNRAKPTPAPETPYRTVPFTSNLGAETQPAFSPDGKQIAFVWNGEDGLHRHIYVKLIGTETQLQLTNGDVDDYNPVWSPDGTSLAFLRIAPTERGIFIVPSIGGAARKLYSPKTKIDLSYEWERGALSWSPDGSRLVFPDGKSSLQRSAIYSFDLKTLEAKPITSPPIGTDGDYSPAFSRDGKHIAFARGTEGFVRDVYVMDAAGGEPRRITFDNRNVAGLTWTADNSAIIFSSNRGGKYSLWQIGFDGQPPKRLPIGSEDAFGPAISAMGNRLAYAQRSAKWGILRVQLTPNAKSPVTRLLSSTEQESAPQYSPDGSRIAFQSLRSGNQEIWVCGDNGSDLVKLTSFGGPLTGSPNWSPDGQQIVFDSRPDAHSHIYVIGVNGGQPTAITRGDYNDIVPSWSRDGKSIYFGSNRSGTWQIWRVATTGGQPQQLTRQGGFVGVESSDGKWLFYAKGDQPGVWQVSTQGGEETQVLKQPSVGDWGYWNVWKDSIYYLDSTGNTTTINAFSTKTHRSTRVYTLEHTAPPFAGLTVAPDGKSLIFTDLTEAGSHITLVENFR